MSTTAAALPASSLHVGYLAGGLLAGVLVLVSGRIRTVPVTGPLLALLLGVLLGPYALDVLVVPEASRETMLLEGSRLLLAVSLVGVALRFPLHDLRRQLRPVGLLLLLGMPAAALVTGGLGVVLLGLPGGLALLLGACLSPTDPVLASGVVSGGPAERVLPARVRAVLTGESGANDGLALPFVLVGLALVLPSTVGHELGRAVYQLVVATVVGALVGWGTGRAMQAAQRRHEEEGPSELVLTLVMAVAALGLCRLLDSDGVLGVFVAGLGYNAVVAQGRREQEETLDDVANRYLVVPAFLFLGALLPLGDWADLGPGAVAFVAAVLLLRRWPAVVASTPALGLPLRDGVFAGWFGPMGVSAVFYLALSGDEGVQDPRLLAAGTLVVAASTVVHGVTALPGRRLYGRVAARTG